MIKIPVKFSKLEKIIHLADIHIRLYKRHIEYRECFETLYNNLKSTNLENSIIFVGGDIVHAKTDMSPEMVSLASDFLKSLADIAPTILIAGNHDCNLSNPSRLDALSPIVENLNHSNLFYLRDTDIYEIADTQFALFSIFDTQEKWPSSEALNSKTKIALYHGPVNNAQLDSGMVVSNRQVNNSLFNGYDIVLLGDIHKHQILQTYDKTLNRPIMVYAGSLIQQSYGESLGNHGWCEWDVDTKTFEFKELDNTYGYFTLTVRDNKMPIIPALPKNIRLRVFSQNVETTTIKKLYAVLKRTYDVQEFLVNKVPEKFSQFSKQSTGIIDDVHDLGVQNKLIESYLSRHFSMIDSDLLVKINDINALLNHKIQEEDFSRNVRWRPILFEFSNMFSYGPGNKLYFDKMKGVYGLFSPNASGKTSAFDALMFCLYDKTPRAFKASHIMNNRKNKFECYLQLEINGNEYGIRRVGTRKPDGDVKVDVDFWRVETDETITSLNGEDRRDTDEHIRSYVGTYDDFILTNLSVQNNSSIFIEKGQSERKDLLGQFMGINIFDKLYTLALDEMKEVTGALKKFNKEPSGATIAEIQNKIDEYTSEYDENEKLLSSTKTEAQKLTSEIASFHALKTPIDEEDIDIKKLGVKKDEVQELLKTFDAKLVKLNETLSRNTETKTKLDKEILYYETDKNIEKSYMTVSALNKKRQNITSELRILQTKIRNDEDKLQKLSQHEYDPNCKFCMNNIFVKDAIKTKELLKEELTSRTELDKQRKDIDDELLSFGDIEIHYKKYLDSKESLLSISHELVDLSNKILTIKTTVDKHEETLQNIISKEKKYYDSIDIIQKNLKIDEKIAKVEQQSRLKQSSINSLETKLRGLHGDIQVLRANKSEILRVIKEAEELEKVYHAYEYYIEAVNRNGIPYELISRVIPSIESEVNNILSQIVDFTVALELDGKNINGKIIYDFDRIWPLELSSGMEKFITSLAIRVALINVSNLPKSNFLIIDEGLGTLSAENLMAMNMLFSILKNQFEFLIVISHLDAVRDMAEFLIEIRRDKGYSYINY